MTACDSCYVSVHIADGHVVENGAGRRGEKVVGQGRYYRMRDMLFIKTGRTNTEA